MVDLKKGKTTSIAKKVIVFVIAVNLFVSVIVLIFQIGKDSEEFKANLNEKFKNFEKSLGPLALNLWNRNVSIVKSFLKSVVAQTDFSYTFIKKPGEKGDILYEFPPLDAIPKLDKGFEKRVYVNISFYVSQNHVNDKCQKQNDSFLRNVV